MANVELRLTLAGYAPLTAVSDSEGKYGFSKLPGGVYSLCAHRRGYPYFALDEFQIKDGGWFFMVHPVLSHAHSEHLTGMAQSYAPGVLWPYAVEIRTVLDDEFTERLPGN